MGPGLQNPQIVALLAESESDEDSMLLAAYNSIKELAKEDGLLETNVRIEWFRVGVHAYNREGIVCNGKEALEIWNKVDAIGFDPTLIKDATCFEEGDDRENIKRFMEVIAADPDIPNYDQNKIESVACACSHFNIAIGQAFNEIEHPNKHLTVDGKLNVQKIIERFPLIKPIFTNRGLEWDRWKKKAMILYPSLPRLAQRALNVKGQTTQGQSNFELYIRACNLFSSPVIRAKMHPDAFVYAQLEKMQTRASRTEMESIVMVARKYGTINNAPLQQHIGAFKRKGRSVAAQVWKYLAEIKFARSELCPHVVQSLLMAAADTPDGVINGKDVKVALSKNKDDMKLIEQIIRTSLDMLSLMHLPKDIEIKSVARLRTSMVLKFLKKSAFYEKQTYYEIAQSFHADCNSHTTTHAQVTSPFEVFKPRTEMDPPIQLLDESQDGSQESIVDGAQVESQVAPLPINTDIVEYDSNGIAVDKSKEILISKGFDVGVFVGPTSGIENNLINSK